MSSVQREFSFRSDAPCALCLSGRPTERLEWTLQTVRRGKREFESRVTLPCCTRCVQGRSKLLRLGFLITVPLGIVLAIVVIVNENLSWRFKDVCVVLGAFVVPMAIGYALCSSLFQSRHRNSVETWLKEYAMFPRLACPKCQRALDRPGYLVCPHCGKQLVVPR